MCYPPHITRAAWCMGRPRGVVVRPVQSTVVDVCGLHFAVSGLALHTMDGARVHARAFVCVCVDGDVYAHAYGS